MISAILLTLTMFGAAIVFLVKDPEMWVGTVIFSIVGWAFTCMIVYSLLGGGLQ
jgi:hypothetical protein